MNFFAKFALRCVILNNVEKCFAVEAARLIRIRRLAQLTLEVLPKVGRHNRTLLHDPLVGEPRFETAVMDEAHRTGTLARRKQRIVNLFFFHEANAANWRLLGTRIFQQIISAFFNRTTQNALLFVICCESLGNSGRTDEFADFETGLVVGLVWIESDRRLI